MLLDEIFLWAENFLLDTDWAVSKDFIIGKQASIHYPEWTVSHREMMNEFWAEGYLKTLYGRKKQCPQFLVKEIKIDGIIEMTVGLEYMGSFVLFHRAKIIRQTEITHDFQLP